MLCAKGIEQASGLLMTEVIAADACPAAPMAVLSGPDLRRRGGARPADRRHPGLRRRQASAAQLVKAIGTATFRPYLSDDLIGAEIGGAVKNVLAIACGIVHGTAARRATPAPP